MNFMNMKRSIPSEVMYEMQVSNGFDKTSIVLCSLSGRCFEQEWSHTLTQTRLISPLSKGVKCGHAGFVIIG